MEIYVTRQILEANGLLRRDVFKKIIDMIQGCVYTKFQVSIVFRSVSGGISPTDCAPHVDLKKNIFSFRFVRG